ncbi:MAG: YbaB/EbfC family nucleoid-associated protein [Planctomycetes bacterium]|nr:YbaB/EbfC family nucleoid-associated protein [Planctomycetota bacterium]
MDMNDLMGNMGPIQDAMSKAGDERGDALIEGSAGGGAVKVVLKGDLTLKDIKIAPAAISAEEEDVSMLEDLIIVAVNDALTGYKMRFGGTPEEQLQKSLMNSDIGSLLGPMLGGLGK